MLCAVIHLNGEAAVQKRLRVCSEAVAAIVVTLVVVMVILVEAVLVVILMLLLYGVLWR